MSMEDTLAYIYRPGKIYLNLTNACTNTCSFCARTFGIFTLGPFDLSLSSVHDPEEYIAALEGCMTREGAPQEVVFCGYGEPTLRFETLLRIAAWSKGRGLTVRLNTNGQAILINGGDALARLAQHVDRVNVSVNAPDEESYQRICCPRMGEATWRGVMGFLRLAKVRIGDVWASAVGRALSPEELSALRELMRLLGIPLHVR